MSASILDIGIVLPASAEWPELRDLARQAEDVGIASLWVPDGFAEDHLEAWTVMSGIATFTDRIEVGVHMLNPSLRDPLLLTKAAATLDRLAPGRIRVLLGTGWDRADYAALGREFPKPAARAKAAKEAVAALKSGAGVSIEVSGVRDELIRLAANEADGWAVSADALDAFFERVSFLRRACADAGRDVGDLRVSCTVPIEATAERAADLANHGADELFVVLPEDSRDGGQLEQLVREVRPQLV